MNIERERERMIADIEAGVAMTRRLIGRERLDARVMAAMRRVPREKFVPPNYRHAAFRDGALPAGHGQTISQPYMVALMTDLLETDAAARVLEVGTGTGYQAAVLAELVGRVYSIERIPALAREARQRLDDLGYANIETRCGDGYRGWPEAAPFDAVVVTAAAPFIPPALVEQLAPGGRMAIPVGVAGLRQQLMLLRKDERGEVDTRAVLDVAFVPLVEGVSDAGS